MAELEDFKVQTSSGLTFLHPWRAQSTGFTSLLLEKKFDTCQVTRRHGEIPKSNSRAKMTDSDLVRLESLEKDPPVMDLVSLVNRR